MEKLQTLLWILFGVGAFVYRMIKKAQETTSRESRERPVPATPSLPDASFQELLRQLQSRNAPAAVPADAPRFEPAQPRTPAGRPMPLEKAPPARSQERKQVKYKSLEASATARPINPATPVVRRGAALPRAIVTAQPDPTFTPYAGAPAPNEAPVKTVRRMLAQPGGARTAFVLSEIFQRKW
jgi:hypothetical protein